MAIGWSLLEGLVFGVVMGGLFARALAAAPAPEQEQRVLRVEV